MKCKNVAVFGAGAMGSGIAQVVAKAGMGVILVDIAQGFVDKARGQIEKRLSKDVDKGKMTAGDKDRAMRKIQGTTEPKDVAGADLIIEAVVEELPVKASLFAALNTICPPSAVFATNTSTLSVTQLSQLSGRPDRFMGLHFFNPVHIMRLTEVVPGLGTSQESVEFGISFVKTLGKVPVVAKDCPGFLVNRILLSYVTEAFMAAQEGIPPLEVDEKVRKAGFPMGPLELSDMVGIDISMHSFPIMHGGYGERFPIPLLVEKLVGAGRLGVKAGKGIYNNGKIDDEFLGIVGEVQRQTGIFSTSFSAERLILRQVNEAIYCLQEGVASAEDIDRAMVLGTGFPVDKEGVGGPLHWADERGLDEVLQLLEDLKNHVGARFWPHYLLKNCVHAGYLGKKTNRGVFAY